MDLLSVIDAIAIEKREREPESLRFKLERAGKALAAHPYEWTFELWVDGLRKAVRAKERELRELRARTPVETTGRDE